MPHPWDATCHREVGDFQCGSSEGDNKSLSEECLTVRKMIFGRKTVESGLIQLEWLWQGGRPV